MAMKVVVQEASLDLSPSTGGVALSMSVSVMEACLPTPLRELSVNRC